MPLCIVCRILPGIIKEKYKKWFYCDECFIKINYKQCPNCKNCIEKRDGCEKIFCVCNKWFYYCCGQKFSYHKRCNKCMACYKELCCGDCIECCTNDCKNMKTCLVCKKIRKKCKCVRRGPFKFNPYSYNKPEHPMQLRKKVVLIS